MIGKIYGDFLPAFHLRIFNGKYSISKDFLRGIILFQGNGKTYFTVSDFSTYNTGISYYKLNSLSTLNESVKKMELIIILFCYKNIKLVSMQNKLN